MPVPARFGGQRRDPAEVGRGRDGGAACSGPDRDPAARQADAVSEQAAIDFTRGRGDWPGRARDQAVDDPSRGRHDHVRWPVCDRGSDLEVGERPCDGERRLGDGVVDLKYRSRFAGLAVDVPGHLSDSAGRAQITSVGEVAVEIVAGRDHDRIGRIDPDARRGLGDAAPERENARALAVGRGRVPARRGVSRHSARRGQSGTENSEYGRDDRGREHRPYGHPWANHCEASLSRGYCRRRPSEWRVRSIG